MAKTWSMTEDQNQHPCSNEMINTCENDGQAPWSDLNHDMLFLVMMKLGFFYFSAFSGVCKSWRSFARFNMFKFMSSRLPMSTSISTESNEEDYCYLEETEGRSFKTILPHSGGRSCVGVTYGHLIFIGRKTNDFWLLNPNKRHGVHFHDNPFVVINSASSIRVILDFSPSKSKWLFVMTDRSTNIWFSIAGEGTWNHVSSTFPIVDLHPFKGKIYAIDNAHHLCELTLDSPPRVMLLETKNFPIFSRSQQLVSSHISLYMMGYLSDGSYKVRKLDLDEMNWVRRRKSREFINSKLKPSTDVKLGKCKFVIQ